MSGIIAVKAATGFCTPQNAPKALAVFYTPPRDVDLLPDGGLFKVHAIEMGRRGDRVPAAVIEYLEREGGVDAAVAGFSLENMARHHTPLIREYRQQGPHLGAALSAWSTVAFYR